MKYKTVKCRFHSCVLFRDAIASEDELREQENTDLCSSSISSLVSLFSNLVVLLSGTTAGVSTSSVSKAAATSERHDKRFNIYLTESE